MKAQVIVTPLPQGSKLEATAPENHEQLMIANDNSEIETEWWEHYLLPLETKYNLFYRSGNKVFQIYYHQGKNLAANKEINQVISHAVQKANNNWKEILRTIESFNIYRNQQIKLLAKTISQELKEIVDEQKQLETTSEKYQELETKKTKISNDLENDSVVKSLNKQADEYQKFVRESIHVYLNNGGDFKTFLQTLTFKTPEESLVN